MSALKPCPFCGGIEGLSVDGSAAHYVYCNGCDAAGPVGTSDQSKDAAIAAWNRRAGDNEVEKLRAALRDLYHGYVRTLEAGRQRIIDWGGDCDPVDVMEKRDPCLVAARAALEDRT